MQGAGRFLPVLAQQTPTRRASVLHQASWAHSRLLDRDDVYSANSGLWTGTGGTECWMAARFPARLR